MDRLFKDLNKVESAVTDSPSTAFFAMCTVSIKSGANTTSLLDTNTACVGL